MSFAGPFWLLALAPWAAVVLFLLWGRRRRVDVPFLDLWPAPGDAVVRVRRRATPPPAALALAILATLLAILAAARPALRPARGGATVTVVLDRGFTMSARGAASGETRLAEATRELQAALGAGAPVRAVDRWVVPAAGGPTRGGSASDLLDPPARMSTAVDCRKVLRAAVRSALIAPEAASVVVVVSDQEPGSTDARVVRVGPGRAARNARIVSLAARETPAAQVMVRARGARGSANRARVRVTSGDASAEREVELRGGGGDGDGDVFIDLPRLGETVKAELLLPGGDDQPADDTAWLVRESSWPRVEPRAPLPAHLARLVEVYARRRPPADASSRIVIVDSPPALPAGERGVVLAPAAPASAGASREALAVADHPLTRGVTWSEVGAPDLASAPPPPGWAPVVSAGGKVWVAVREQPIRAVWIGFDSTDWARSSEFVVFWANAFDWVGVGGERFASHPVGSLEGDWSAVELAGSVGEPQPLLWPGLYRRAADGVLRALHAPDVPFPPAGADDWRERLARLIREAEGQVDLGPVLALAALACLLTAAAMWKRRPRRAETRQPAAT